MKSIKDSGGSWSRLKPRGPRISSLDSDSLLRWAKLILVERRFKREDLIEDLLRSGSCCDKQRQYVVGHTSGEDLTIMSL